MKKITASFLAFVSLVMPWFVLTFSFEKGVLVPAYYLCLSSMIAIAAIFLSAPVYWKNKTDLISLATTICAVIGLFYSLPLIYILLALAR